MIGVMHLRSGTMIERAASLVFFDLHAVHIWLTAIT